MNTTAPLRLVAMMAAVFTLLLVATLAQAADSLPSWNDTDTKKAIVAFVEKSTSDSSSPDYIAIENRIVTFDNDGTLWVEHPMYTQLAFALDRVRELAPEHPEWKTTQPFQAVLENDMKTLGDAGEKGIMKLLMATHAGMSTAEWFATARHPRFNKPYTELTYLPMIELLDYLRANGFKTYIVSGGGIEFMRPMTDAVYGIPPEQVIGSSIKTEYQVTNGKPELVRLPEINFVDDKAGKPVGINMFIGKRPVAAFGNSDGDRQMLEWTDAGDGNRLMGLVYHDDAEREYAYGPAGGLPNTPFGALSQSTVDEAKKNGWLVISMKKDWARVFSFDEYNSAKAALH